MRHYRECCFRIFYESFQQYGVFRRLYTRLHSGLLQPGTRSGMGCILAVLGKELDGEEIRILIHARCRNDAQLQYLAIRHQTYTGFSLWIDRQLPVSRFNWRERRRHNDNRHYSHPLVFYVRWRSRIPFLNKKKVTKQSKDCSVTLC